MKYVVLLCIWQEKWPYNSEQQQHTRIHAFDENQNQMVVGERRWNVWGAEI